MSFSENRFPPIGSSPRACFSGTCSKPPPTGRHYLSRLDRGCCKSCPAPITAGLVRAFFETTLWGARLIQVCMLDRASPCRRHRHHPKPPTLNRPQLNAACQVVLRRLRISTGFGPTSYDIPPTLFGRHRALSARQGRCDRRKAAPYPD
jgi:hypothetical protein